MERSSHQANARASLGRHLLSVREAAEMLGIGHAMVYKLLAAGQLPSVRIGGRRLFDPADLDRFIDERREPAASPTAAGEEASTATGG
jgi:excisionase family DNA binding protein